jgi:hypothetical protein
MPYDAAKKKWDRIVCASFPRVVPGSLAAIVQEREKGRAEEKKKGKQWDKDKKTPRASFNGGPVCFAFNQAQGCGRAQTAGGCTVGGKSYHHVCNFYSGVNKAHCLAQHSKYGNH